MMYLTVIISPRGHSNKSCNLIGSQCCPDFLSLAVLAINCTQCVCGKDQHFVKVLQEREREREREKKKLVLLIFHSFSLTSQPANNIIIIQMSYIFRTLGTTQ